MSKSKGNFILVREMMKTVAPQAVRLFLVSKHYRSPIDFSEEELRATERGWGRLVALKERLDRVYEAAGADPLPDRERLAMTVWDDESPGRGLPEPAERGQGELSDALWEETANAWGRFGQAMDDDLNSALAVGCLFDLARGLNRYLDGLGGGAEAEARAAEDGVFRIADGVFHRLADVLGLNLEAAEGRSAAGDEREGALEALVETIVELRDEARRQKDWARADRLRDRLAQVGIQLEDTPQGTRWSWQAR